MEENETFEKRRLKRCLNKIRFMKAFFKCVEILLRKEKENKFNQLLRSSQFEKIRIAFFFDNLSSSLLMFLFVEFLLKLFDCDNFNVSMN